MCERIARDRVVCEKVVCEKNGYDKGASRGKLSKASQVTR